MKTSLARALTAVVVLSSPAFAQARPATTQPAASAQAAPTGSFETGPIYAGPRIWIGNLNGAIAFGGQIEKGFTKAGQYGPGIIGGGVGIDWYSWSYDFPSSLGSYKYSVIPIQIFSNYHFVIETQKKLDPYVGLALVYSIVSASWSGSNDPGSADANSTAFAGQAGLRYFLKDNLALQGQIGFGYGTLGLGATWKF
jgi:opacity protein-like surface antigen